MHEAVLMLAKQRTGCLTAWKRLLFWQYGMQKSKNSNEYLFLPPKSVARPFKDAFIEMVEEKRFKLRFVAADKFKDEKDFADYLSDLFSGKPNKLKAEDDAALYPNKIGLFVIPSVKYDHDTLGWTRKIRDIVTKEARSWCFVFWNRHEGQGEAKIKNAANTAAHELVHAFLLEGSGEEGATEEQKAAYEHYGFGKSGEKDEAPYGHDLNPGWKKGNCLMRWKGGGDYLCLQHLQAMRRQRYDFFRFWLEEKDRKKRLK